MKERPILFSAPMVRAILDGRKTQTRRIVKIPGVMPRALYPITSPDEEVIRFDDGTFHYLSTGGMSGPYVCPHGKPGDRLWVRESHWRFTGCPVNGKPWAGFVESPDGDPYKARCYDDYGNMEGLLGACAAVRAPSIHMPRWASRITLEIVGVRVERLQDISEDDALAEGVDPAGPVGYIPASDRMGRCRYQFANLWDEINGHGSWDANPWVWVIEFKKLEQPT